MARRRRCHEAEWSAIDSLKGSRVQCISALKLLVCTYIKEETGRQHQHCKRARDLAPEKPVQIIHHQGFPTPQQINKFLSFSHTIFQHLRAYSDL
ncbi:unnamed protein product [Allacma fusca]|uniref:Uncharacterized protein n=1 Tax=Allacma fusca TaxID=39272 RepID=A0A8J2MHD5_9HEXA|nr:unnamed protein product [Allacma fusca]